MPTVGTFAAKGLGATVDFTPDTGPSAGVTTTYCFIRATGPTTTAGEIETTNSCSLALEFIADLVDEGTIEVEANLDPNLPTLVDGLEGELILHFPVKPGETTEATFTGQAFIMSAPKVIPVRDRMTETVTFRISGTLTHVPGA